MEISLDLKSNHGKCMTRRSFVIIIHLLEASLRKNDNNNDDVEKYSTLFSQLSYTQAIVHR